MSEFIDLSGFKFNMLKVIQLHCGGHGLHLQWECLCDCGNKCIVTGSKLKNGHTKSCGCLLHSRTFIDLTGMKFNLLTVLSYHGKKDRHVRWNCVCDCGEYTSAFAYNLKNGAVKSCGCLLKSNKQNITHGLTHTRLYNIWDNMKGRCYRPSMYSFKDYGAKGIRICDDWLNNCTKFFEWALNNGYKKTLTIERNDNSKNYEPDNCRWIPKSEQSRNRTVALGVKKAKEIKHQLKIGISVREIATSYNVNYATILNIKHGKSYSYVNV